MQETDCRTAAFLTSSPAAKTFYNAVAAYGRPPAGRSPPLSGEIPGKR
jgi:hypothetical protein